MKSSIKIDVDQSNNPVLRVILSDESDDLRDKMMKKFFDGAKSFSYKHQERLVPNYFELIPVSEVAVDSPYMSRFHIDDDVSFVTDENLKIGWEKAKKDNPTKNENEIEWEPSYNWGKVVAVKFTKGKVYYDCIDDITTEVHRDIASQFVKNLGHPLEVQKTTPA